MDGAFDFWKREYERLERFKIANPLFVECFKDNQHQMMPFFFLRKYYNPKNELDGRIYDADATVSTNGDVLAANLLAIERYSHYAIKKLEKL